MAPEKIAYSQTSVKSWGNRAGDTTGDMSLCRLIDARDKMGKAQIASSGGRPGMLHDDSDRDQGAIVHIASSGGASGNMHFAPFVPLNGGND